MALPAHLARYDSLLDLVAEALVREILEGNPIEKPAVPGRAKPRAEEGRGNRNPERTPHAM